MLRAPRLGGRGGWEMGEAPEGLGKGPGEGEWGKRTLVGGVLQSGALSGQGDVSGMRRAKFFLVVASEEGECLQW